MADLTPEEISDLWAVHRGEVRSRALLQKYLDFDDTRSWVDPRGYRLSDRLWQQRAGVRAAIDAQIREALGQGADAITTARRLEHFLDPRYAPLRTVDGRILRDGRKGVLTNTPRGGTGSYPARRLMRTETTRAHGQAQLKVADGFPSVVHWRLSPSHPEIDICDEYADRDNGFGPGRYLPREAPRYPAHPQCLCTLRVHPVVNDQSLVNHLRRKYGLGDDLTPEDFARLGIQGDVPIPGFTRPATQVVRDPVSAARSHAPGQFQTVQEATIWAQENVALSVDFGKASLDVVNRVTKSLAENMERFAPGYTRNPGRLDLLRGRDLGARVRAEASGDYLGFNFLKIAEENQRRDLYAHVTERGKPRRWSVGAPDPIAGTITHEWGHVIHRNASIALGDAGAAEKQFRVAWRKMKKDDRWDYLEALSDYAGTNDREFFAESYVMYIYEPQNMPQPLREKMAEIIERGRYKP